MELINISFSDAAITALLGYVVVFVGLILLMLVIMGMGKLMAPRKAESPAPQTAHGTAGDIKLYDTDPRDAAMVMAIVADTLGKPLNELRFISIREVKKDEV